MKIVSFPITMVKPLAEHTRQCVEHSPTYDQHFDSAYWLDKYRKSGLSEAQVMEMRGKHLDMCKIPAGFWLVKDHGVYLMSNGSPRLTLEEGKRGQVVYAKGCNPDKDPDWYEAAYTLGGDDFAIFIPLEWYDIAMSKGKRVLSFRMGKRSISLNT